MIKTFEQYNTNDDFFTCYENNNDDIFVILPNKMKRENIIVVIDTYEDDPHFYRGTWKNIFDLKKLSSLKDLLLEKPYLIKPLLSKSKEFSTEGVYTSELGEKYSYKLSFEALEEYIRTDDELMNLLDMEGLGLL